MAEAETTRTVRFGRTVVQPAVGDLVDQSVEAIAEALDISGGAVKKSLFKARQTLHRRLSEEVHDA